MPTRIRAIGEQIITDAKASTYNAQSAALLPDGETLSMTAVQWRAALTLLMADKDVKNPTLIASNREKAHLSTINAVQELSDTAVEAGEPDYMAEALITALTTLRTALQRPYDPATDSPATKEPDGS